MFRDEATGPGATGLHGQILVGHHRSSRWIVLAAMSALIFLVCLLTWGSYTKRATGVGIITPVGGVSRIHAAQPGFVIEAAATEGMRVKAGDTLFVISSDRQAGEQAQYQRSIVDSIRARERLIDDQRRSSDEAARRDVDSQQRRREGIQHEIVKVRSQLAALQHRLRQADKEAEQYQALFAQGLVTRDQRAAREAIADDLGNRVSSLQREEISLRRDAEAAVMNIEASEARNMAVSQSLTREATSIREQLVEAESRRRIVVTAPRDGTITLVQAQAGSYVDTGRPVATLLDADASLGATVHANDKTVAFLRKGTKATVRVAALPHQRYGTIPATVGNVSRLPAQNSERLESIGNLETSGEALYAVTLNLERQMTSMAPSDTALRAGMRVEVDFTLDKRHLWEWMWEPMLVLHQRLQR